MYLHTCSMHTIISFTWAKVSYYLGIVPVKTLLFIRNVQFVYHNFLSSVHVELPYLAFLFLEAKLINYCSFWCRYSLQRNFAYYLLLSHTNSQQLIIDVSVAAYNFYPKSIQIQTQPQLSKFIMYVNLPNGDPSNAAKVNLTQHVTDILSWLNSVSNDFYEG
jgi:hypothetical protein